MSGKVTLLTLEIGKLSARQVTLNRLAATDNR